MLCYSSSLALSLVLLVTLIQVVPLVYSSRDLIGVPTHGVPEDHLLMMERFHGWMANHGRSYATTEEKLRRFEIYRSNVEFIEAANQDGRLTYTLGENQFSDLTHEEFLSTYTSHGVAPSELESEMLITTRAGDVNQVSCPSESIDVPPHVNWTEKGKVTEVKDQYQCGSCWAFSAVATIESAYAIKKRIAPPVLSEQQLIDCDKNEDQRGCKSGYTQKAYVWVAGNGITSNSAYPYHGNDNGKCQKGKPKVATISNYRYAGDLCEKDIMAAVYDRPVAVQFSADECFKAYKTGVYNGMCVKHGVYSGPCPSGPRDHSLTIVGYDDVEKYWIAKNSWGTGWGNKGYVLLKKDVANREGLCGLAIKPVYPIV
ncbi:unnamed protein product [Alopecurus aequalis]